MYELPIYIDLELMLFDNTDLARERKSDMN